MNEYQFALMLKEKYEEAKSQFEHPNILDDLFTLENTYNLKYDKLKEEVEKLGYHIKLAKDIHTPYWQEQWKIAPIFAFYKSQEDL